MTPSVSTATPVGFSRPPKVPTASFKGTGERGSVAKHNPSAVTCKFEDCCTRQPSAASWPWWLSRMRKVVASVCGINFLQQSGDCLSRRRCKRHVNLVPIGEDQIVMGNLRIFATAFTLIINNDTQILT